MMSYILDRYLTPPMTWRDLFELVIVQARKPDFFTGRSPVFEVVSEDGLVRPARELGAGALAYLGGSAGLVERFLGCSGDEILYVGDHMFGDVLLSNKVLRWRTALILRELDDEVAAIASFRDTEQVLAARMALKEALEAEMSQLRLALQRRQTGYGPQPEASAEALRSRLGATRDRLLSLDAEIVPMARAATQLNHPRWGLLTRAGNDKSHLARQVERYADIYTSRVSNLLLVTPFVYLRSARGSLPHDPSTPPGPTMAPVIRGPAPPAG
jgi:hypothetical protein